MGGFSFASVVLSYFMVGGGMFVGLLAAGYAKVGSLAGLYLMLGVGAFLGGYFAARASRGRTIVEPAIGALAVVGTLAGLVAAGESGRQLLSAHEDAATKAIAYLALAGGGGSLVGAWIGEKFFGDAPTSTLPWFAYTAFATFGATVMVSTIAAITSNSVEGMAKTMLIGFAAGCLLSGIAVGASSRARPLLASFVGGGLGVVGLGLLASRVSPGGADKDVAAGIAVLAVGGGVICLIGALIGWAAVGKKAPGAVT